MISGDRSNNTVLNNPVEAFPNRFTLRINQAIHLAFN